MKKLRKVFSFIVSLPIYLYKFVISPFLPHVCRFSPTCSNYCIEAIKEFGLIKGGIIGFKRICRCTPNNKYYGYDPLPINIKGEGKWLF